MGVLHFSLDHAWSLYKRRTDALFLEFGTFKGVDINFIAKTLTEKAKHLRGEPGELVVHGFDSFQGLPEEWHNGKLMPEDSSTAYPAGKFDLQGVLPSVHPIVQLHPGWFEDTVHSFLDQHPQRPVAFIHADADLYSSTKTVLWELCSRGMLVPGTIINFDEYANYKGWEDGEYKAWQEVVREFGVEYKYLCYHGPKCDKLPDLKHPMNKFGFKSVVLVVTAIHKPP